MNRVSLNSMGWIAVGLIIVALLVSRATRHPSHIDTFLNVPQQVNPDAPIATNPDVSTANDNYAALLLFLQNNPSQAARFLADIQQKFFDKSCTVRSDVDFQGIVNFSNGAPFQ